MIKRVAGCLLVHVVLMATSYMLAQRCGDAVNPFVGIWFGSASLFFFFIGTACFIEAVVGTIYGMVLAAQGKEPRR